MRFPIGEYREQVVIEEDISDPKDSQYRTEYGDLVSSWRGLAFAYARISPLSGREFWEAQQAQATNQYRINFRYFEGLKPQKHRLRLGQRIFNLDSVLDLDNQNYEHECICTEVLSNSVEQSQ